MKRFSLKKEIILKKKSDFNLVISRGKSFRTEFFRAFYIPNEQNKVGFAVQSGFKNKVERNNLKRKLKELWRLNYRDFDICGKFVIIIKLISKNHDFLSLEKDFRILLKKTSE